MLNIFGIAGHMESLLYSQLFLSKKLKNYLKLYKIFFNSFTILVIPELKIHKTKLQATVS